MRLLGVGKTRHDQIAELAWIGANRLAEHLHGDIGRLARSTIKRNCSRCASDARTGLRKAVSSMRAWNCNTGASTSLSCLRSRTVTAVFKFLTLQRATCRGERFAHVRLRL
jgi:hypothetical protein